MNNNSMATVKQMVDFDYLDSAIATKKASFTEANQSIYTGINNKQIKVRVGDILDALEAKQKNRYDEFLTMTDIIEAARNKELIYSENAASGVYQKLGVTSQFMGRCSDDLKKGILTEFAAQYDASKAGKPLVRLEKQEGKAPKVRAVLSSDYAIIDNFPVMNALFGRDRDQIVCVKSFVDDNNYMRLEMIVPERAFEMTEPNGKTNLYYPVMGISNSEVGRALLGFMSGLHRGVCANGLHVRVNEFITSVRHIYQDVAGLLSKMQTADMNILIDKNNKIIDLYKNSQGIYVPNVNEEIYATMGAEQDEEGNITFKHPQSLVDAAVSFAKTEYATDKPSYWHVIQTIERAINYQYGKISQTGNRMDYEGKFYGIFNSRLNQLVKA